MKKIGLVVAVEIEALKQKYGDPEEFIEVHNQKVSRYNVGGNELYAIKCGAGEIGAASATQLLISEFNVEMIFNYGIVGGLTEEISKTRICVVKDVVHYDYDTSEVDKCEVGRYLDYPSIFIPTSEELVKFAVEIVPELKVVTCASGDKFIGEAEAKKAISENFKSQICDMESAGIVLTANRNEVPCLLIKMVADGIDGGADEFFKEYVASSNKSIDILDDIINKF